MLATEVRVRAVHLRGKLSLLSLIQGLLQIRLEAIFIAAALHLSGKLNFNQLSALNLVAKMHFCDTAFFIEVNFDIVNTDRKLLALGF